MASSIRSTNELFHIGADNRLSYSYQDKEKYNDIPLPVLEEVQEFSNYTTSLIFRNENGNPRTRVTVRINASEWIQCMVNGPYTTLDNDLK